MESGEDVGDVEGEFGDSGNERCDVRGGGYGIITVKCFGGQYYS